MAEGSKAFINHLKKSEIQERSGVRDLRDFAGIYKNIKRDGDKITADLYATGKYFDLLSDIARLQPNNVGSSLNAKVYSKMQDDGLESVEDVHSVKSFGIVSNAATVSSLFENALESKKSDLEKLLDDKDKEDKYTNDTKKAADDFIKKIEARMDSHPAALFTTHND